MKTYLFSGSYVEFFGGIAKKLDATGKWKPAIPGGVLLPDAKAPEYTDLLYVTVIIKPVAITARNTYNIKCHWHNQYDVDSKAGMDNKMQLHKNLEKSTVVLPTSKLSEYVYVSGEAIARPAGKGFHSGKDIMYIHDRQSWYKAIEFYKDTDVVVTRILSNPVLLDGRKSHIRLYLFVHSGTKLVKFSPMGPMFTAKLPYVHDNWENMDVHDTHMASTDKPYRFPEDYPYKEQLGVLAVQLRQMEILLTDIIGGFKPYSQAKDAFELFAADLMATSSGVLKILEINSKIGMDLNNPGLVDDLASWVGDKILEITKVA